MQERPNDILIDKELMACYFKEAMRKELSPTFYLRAQKRHGGRYILRNKNQVLVSAKTLKDLLKIMKLKKIKHGIGVSLGYVPSTDSIHVYALR